MEAGVDQTTHQKQTEKVLKIKLNIKQRLCEKNF